MVAVEHGGRVVYRAKVKSPDYLRVLKLVMTCTYARTVEMMDANGLTTWAELDAHLRGLGREQVPEEVLAFYREHYDAHARYLADCDRLRTWGNADRRGSAARRDRYGSGRHRPAGVAEGVRGAGGVAPVAGAAVRRVRRAAHDRRDAHHRPHPDRGGGVGRPSTEPA